MSDQTASSKSEYSLLPLKNVVIFPRTVTTLLVGRPKSVQALEDALERDHRLIVTAQRAATTDDPSSDDLYNVGTLVEIMQLQRQNDGNIQIAVEGIRRVKITNYLESDRFFYVGVQELTEKPGQGAVIEATMRHVHELFEKYARLNQRVGTETLESVKSITHPGYMADLIASHVVQDVHDRQTILEALDQVERLERVSVFMTNEIDVLELDQKIRNKVRSQIDKNQREFYLREQLKAIHDELSGEGGSEMAELRKKIEAKGLPVEVAEKMRKEINRLERMPSVSPEATVVRNYIDWVLSLPWIDWSEEVIDIAVAQQILDDDHFGLEKIKERIIEFLAVRQLMKESETKMRGPLLCFVGPPGVGKTSLGQSIARALGRKFVRISLGGVRDESEIRGHRRTYVGALPGRIIHALKTAGTKNPVILLDEIDKMSSDYRGDPSAAMLEVLDPEQNHTFVDHYIDLPFDLSEVMFIATANVSHYIPRPLLDRMELIELGGYTEEEKVQIARRYLLPKQLAAHGLKPHLIEIPEKMLLFIVRNYTREAGVRNLERKLATICRKAALKVVKGRTTRVRITQHVVEEYLGPGRYIQEILNTTNQIGVAMGLAWTEHGGEMLPVEVAILPGHGALTITGRLGETMQESAKAALSYARSRADSLGIDPSFQEKFDLHIHLPEGAIPKDGPSAGITMATAVISALSRKPVRHDLAMTGEITLRGRVLPIGGLKEKVMAAHRAGIKRIIAPKDNRRDLVEIPRNVQRDMEFFWVETMDEVITNAILLPAEIRLPVDNNVSATDIDSSGVKSDSSDDVEVVIPNAAQNKTSDTEEATQLNPASEAPAPLDVQ